MQPSMRSQRVGLDENNSLEIPGGNQGVAESGQNHEGPKKTSISIFSCFNFAILFIHSFTYPSLLHSLHPPGAVMHCDWELGKQTSHVSWSLDSPSACVWGIELVPCFLMNLRTTFLTSP